MGPKNKQTSKKMIANKQGTKQQCERHKLEGGLGIVLMEFWFSSSYLVCYKKFEGRQFYDSQSVGRQTHLLHTPYLQLQLASLFLRPSLFLSPPSHPPNLMSGHVCALSMPPAWHDLL